MEYLPGYDAWKLREPPELHYDVGECPSCGYPYLQEFGCQCGLGDDDTPVCPECGGTIDEDGQCHDCHYSTE